MKGGKSEFGLHRKIVSKVATFFAHMSLQETEKISDPLSGFFIFRRNLIKPEDIQSQSYKVLLEVVVASHSMNISEISYRFNKRKYGKSKLGNYLSVETQLALSTFHVPGGDTYILSLAYFS